MRTTEVPDAGSWRPGGRRAQEVAAILFLLWLPLCGWLFWHFEGRHLSGAADRLGHFDPQLLPAAPRPGVVNVLYLTDSRCPCSRGLWSQIAAVQRQFGADVQQFIVGDGGPRRSNSAPEPLAPVQAARWLAALPQLPALVVWRADGTLAHVGPLRGGGWCGGDDAVARVRRALDGFSLPPVAQDVAGCFCDVRARMARADFASTTADNPS